MSAGVTGRRYVGVRSEELAEHRAAVDDQAGLRVRGHHVSEQALVATASQSRSGSCSLW
jgi:hypothetical protein